MAGGEGRMHPHPRAGTGLNQPRVASKATASATRGPRPTAAVRPAHRPTTDRAQVLSMVPKLYRHSFIVALLVGLEVLRVGVQHPRAGRHSPAFMKAECVSPPLLTSRARPPRTAGGVEAALKTAMVEVGEGV